MSVEPIPRVILTGFEMRYYDEFVARVDGTDPEVESSGAHTWVCTAHIWKRRLREMQVRWDQPHWIDNRGIDGRRLHPRP